jgi:hypothetical protein
MVLGQFGNTLLATCFVVHSIVCDDRVNYEATDYEDIMLLRNHSQPCCRVVNHERWEFPTAVPGVPSSSSVAESGLASSLHEYRSSSSSGTSGI